MGSSICFVALKAYAVLSGREDVRHIGGAEVQQSLIARGLMSKGYRISFVTLDHGQPDGESLDGITVHPAYGLDDGLPGLRFIHPRVTRVWSAMARADADLYYQRTSDTITGVVAGFCRWHRRPFVFALGALKDCDPALPACTSLRERLPYRYGLKRATRVVAQTRTQQDWLRRYFQVESTVIPSCTAGPPTIEPDDARTGPGRRPVVLWVGRFVPEKRFGLLLDAAERCPEIDFEVLGNGRTDAAASQLMSRATRVPNVHARGYVPHAQALQYYRTARVLVNTSVAEGFPNTFLEAWCRRIPVVTLFDPDGIVSSHRLGLCATGAESLAEALRTLCFDAAAHTELSGNAYEYYLSHHTVEQAVEAYDQLFRELTATAHSSHGRTPPPGDEACRPDPP